MRTRAIWLTGFGIASRLPRERQSPEPPEGIAGTLAYMAREQTGGANGQLIVNLGPALEFVNGNHEL